MDCKVCGTLGAEIDAPCGKCGYVHPSLAAGKSRIITDEDAVVFTAEMKPVLSDVAGIPYGDCKCGCKTAVQGLPCPSCDEEVP